jgi:hypothetical protein
MSTDPAWFYEGNGERVGPVSAGEILSHYQNGSIRAETLVWRAGLGNWIPFSASELASAGPPPVPAIPAIPPLPAAGPPPVPAGITPFVPRAAALRPGFQPQLRYSFGRAWALLTANFWPIVGCLTLTTLILSVASQFFIPVFFLTYPLMAGLYWYLLRQVRGESATVELLFEGFRRQFGPLAIVNLIVVGISMVAMTVLIILMAAGGVFMAGSLSALEGNIENPAAFAALFGGFFILIFLFSLPLMILNLVGTFASILILDCGLEAKASMSLAWVAIRPFLFKFLIFMVATAFLSMAGTIVFLVGMLVTGAWASVALVYLYEDAFGDERPAQPRIA